MIQSQSIALRLASLFAISLSITGCQKAAPLESLAINPANWVRPDRPGTGQTDVTIGDRKNTFRVIGSAALKEKIQTNEILAPKSPRAQTLLAEHASESLSDVPAVTPAPSQPSQQPSLLLSIPLGLVGQQNVFGATITKVSDGTSEALGRLKLTNLDPIHVTTGIVRVPSGEFVLALLGCVQDCSESSTQEPLLGFPIVGVEERTRQVVVDLAPIGNELNLVKMMDPRGAYTRLKAKSSRTTSFDYSMSTLVFDIESEMIPLAANPADPSVPVTTFVARWYLKLTSGFNPAFVSRSPVTEVGYFTTERSTERKISRFSLTSRGGGAPVHYYIKNVPAEYQPGFKAAFDEWNEKMKATIGRDLLSYEFVPEADQRNAQLVAGDIRFNIVEWDLVNKAPYGGLGPSTAHQFSGEIFSANVLIQGPSVISLYKQWFNVTKKAESLRARGMEREAELVILAEKRRVESLQRALERETYAVSLGDRLSFRVVSQMPSLEDPLYQRQDFDETPAGMTYAAYMHGYFREMVAHELGHNLGLRHNFRGNLGAEAQSSEGKVSRSIMEYLNRSYRHLNRISDYDRMAIAFGYAGVRPTQSTWFCTDEDVAEATQPRNSAECSRDDATPDPYRVFEERLAKSVSLIVARGTRQAPAWKPADMDRELKSAINGMASYGASAEASGASWTNFFTTPDRPATPAGVKAFVLARLQAIVCDPSLVTEIASKESEEARNLTSANLDLFRLKVLEAVAPYRIYSLQELSCGTTPITPAPVPVRAPAPAPDPQLAFHG